MLLAGAEAQGCPAGVPGGQTGAPVATPPSEGVSPGAQARKGARPHGSAAAVADIEGKSADRSRKLSNAASGRILIER
ncbi:MAG: hypothetical protein EB067_05220 [Actinobacteria bacterium]|nr:hypothetical protein [Actinomycetota bacterium]